MQMPMPTATPTPPGRVRPSRRNFAHCHGSWELAPDHIVSPTLYNGQFPGPLLRLKEGKPNTVDLFNDTDTPELVHWHGQIIPTAPCHQQLHMDFGFMQLLEYV